jgi:pimeloyl-ACP methyl ester carboxylesterase
VSKTDVSCCRIRGFLIHKTRGPRYSLGTLLGFFQSRRSAPAFRQRTEKPIKTAANYRVFLMKRRCYGFSRGRNMSNRQHESKTTPPTASPAGRQQWVKTPDGVDISVREWGNPAGRPILFVHGLAQAHLCFAPQFESALAERFRLIAYDLRGHGESAKPLDASYYKEGRRWADELAAVIAGAGLDRPVLLGWSLGGRVIRQYLIHHGDRAISGLHFVSSRPFEDPSVLANASRNDITNRPEGLAQIIASNIAFLRACFHRQPSEYDFAVALAYNMIVPQPVREAISGWSTSVEETRAALNAVTVPTLVSHGMNDALILPKAAEMTAAAVRGARISIYDDCGHSPFVEHTERFNRELGEFVASIQV